MAVSSALADFDFLPEWELVSPVSAESSCLAFPQQTEEVSDIQAEQRASNAISWPSRASLRKAKVFLEDLDLKWFNGEFSYLLVLAFHCFQHRSYSRDKSIIPGTDFWERSSPLGQQTVAVCKHCSKSVWTWATQGGNGRTAENGIVLVALLVEHPPENMLYPPETQHRMFPAELMHFLPSPEKPG